MLTNLFRLFLVTFGSVDGRLGTSGSRNIKATNTLNLLNSKNYFLTTQCYVNSFDHLQFSSEITFQKDIYKTKLSYKMFTF